MDGFLRTKPISRGNGQSAVACAAYRSGQELNDERYGKIHNYKRKEHVELQGIALPEEAPEWMKDREKLWNKAEAEENRKDARVAREFILALPHNITKTEQKKIVKDFAKHLADQGMAVDYALHSPGRNNDSRNFHAHFLCTTRECLANGFGMKAADSRSREWNKKSWLEETRTVSQIFINEVLKERGLPEWKYAERNDGKAIHFGENIPKEYKDNTRALNQIREEFTKLEAEEKAIKMELAKEPKQEPKKEPAKKTEQEQFQEDIQYHYDRLTASEKDWKELKKEYSEFEARAYDRALTHEARRFFNNEADEWIKQEPSKRKAIKDMAEIEPSVEKAGLFNKAKVEEQNKKHSEWQEAISQKRQVFNSEVKRYNKIRSLKTDDDYSMFQKDEQRDNKNWYGATWSIKKRLVNFLYTFDKKSAAVVKAFQEAKSFWNERLKLTQDRKRDIDRGMSR